ncbi:hypothetical protein [Rhizobium sp.]|uniref:hypothetical protein n=1 Tax=Rhizobium sp. TaxID=391 RepID=UPI0028A24C9F
MKQLIDEAQWIDLIAAKAKMESVEIAKVLDTHRLKPRQSHAVPRRLLISRLSFRGRKPGDFEQTEIDFTMQEMSPGVYAFISKVNLKGKSSLLAMIRWGLTGTRNLPDDMRGWFETLTLAFKLDDDEYEVHLDDAEASKGRLTKQVRGKRFVVSTFDSAVAFHNTMETLFLSELGLQTLEVVADKGKVVPQTHGWNWLSTAMVIDPDPKSLFGSETMHGMAIRMMQMYLGLPWVTTQTDLVAVKKRLEIERAQSEKAAKDASNQAEARLTALRAELERLGKVAEKSQSVATLRDNLKQANEAYLKASERARKIAPLLEDAERQSTSADETVKQANRELIAFRENRAAGAIFRQLQPISCPGCEEVYTEEVRAEREHHHDCVVCGRLDRRGGGSPEGEEDRLAEEVRQARIDAATLRRRASELRKRLEAAETDAKTSDQLAEKLEADVEAIQSTADPWLELIKIKAQVEELERFGTIEARQGIDEVAILEIAISVTKALYAQKQAEVLSRVSELIPDLARNFGITDLVSVDLKGNTNMDVFLRGGKKTYGSCTIGERMRLKVAATLAIIQSAEEHGVGRHPGLLLVDSIGNNEVVQKDLAKLLVALNDLSSTLPTVQVFIAGIGSDAIFDNVKSENMIQNRADGYLW